MTSKLFRQQIATVDSEWTEWKAQTRMQPPLEVCAIGTETSEWKWNRTIFAEEEELPGGMFCSNSTLAQPWDQSCCVPGIVAKA